MTDSSGPTVTDNASTNRYEARIGEEMAGYAEYGREGDRITFLHTAVEPAFEGKGVGSALARDALDDVRARGETVVPQCAFIAAYIDKHPAYADLVAS